MEGGGGIFLDTNSEASGAVGGTKAKRGKVVKGDSVSVSVGASRKKTLADITNMHQQPLNQQAKQQFVPIAAPDISSDQLLKENAMLMNLVANRNVVIESCKAELQKCQSDFQKLQKQNSELALTNSQMLAELNSSRQRLRELQHELGSKNGILKAMKIELTAKVHTVCQVDANEVGAYQSKQSDQPLQEDNMGDTKRKRLRKSSATAVIKHIKSTEKVDNGRYSLRRQSAGLKAEKPEPTKNFVQGDEVKDDVLHLQENLANENGPTSLESKIQDEAREDTESSGPTNTEQVHAIKNNDKKRHSMRRHSTRRQTDRLRPENPEPTEDSFEIDDAKFNVPHLSENVSEKNCPTTSTVTSGQENNACTLEPKEIRRSSVGRPLRRSVENIVTYKEVSLRVKMRREK